MIKSKLLRVTQMNAVYLDREIEKSLQQLIQEICRNLPPAVVTPISAEINLLLRLGILKYSVISKGFTFGQELLNIRYENISTFKKSLYLIISCLDYIKTRCELWRPSHDINKFIFKFYILIKIIDFLNISVFLRNGVKPLLIERLLGLNQVYATESFPRTFESKYLSRELLWNGFIEILVYMVPLINYYKIKRLVKQFSPFNQKSTSISVISTQCMTIHTKCAHCGESPILPHHMGCAHVFCYVCLRGNQIADSKYECPKCEHKNPNLLCDRVNV